MFGLRLTTKRELAFFDAVMQDLRKEKRVLLEAVEHEKRRAEAAINLLLLKTQKAVLTPEPPMNEDQEDQIKERMFNIFGDDETEEEVLEKLQS